MADKIPEQIIVENILSRLPVKSLCRFKSVSKPWQTSISDPTFVKSYLLTQTRQQGIIILSPGGSLFSLNLDNTIATKLDFPMEWADVLCSSNDMILLVYKNKSEFLVNPSNRSYKKLPRTSFFNTSYQSRYGLGYDSSIDDYKVLKISTQYMYLGDEENDGDDWYSTDVDVYSLKSCSWRKIKANYPYDPSSAFYSLEMVCLNGHLHWITNYDSGLNVIASFDLLHENYCDVPIPNSLDNSHLVLYKLKVLGSCICLFKHTVESEMEISFWVMNEYGVADSWTEFRIPKPNIVFTINILSLLRGGEILFEVNKCKLAVYNIKERKWSDAVLNGYSTNFKACVPYVESLALPNCWDIIDKEEEQLRSAFDRDMKSLVSDLQLRRGRQDQLHS